MEGRIKNTNLCCSMEDGEYIEDHEKMEKEETLRKWFDVQHVRQGKRLSAVSKEGTTILRPPLTIYVEEETTAFGHPIPSLPRTSFSLPWGINSEEEHEENGEKYSSRKSRPRPMTIRQMPNKRHISYFCPHCHQRFSSWLEKSAHSRQMSCFSWF